LNIRVTSRKLLALLINRKTDSPPRSLLAEALGLAGNLGFTVAVPLVLFALIGRFADRRFHTSPWFFLAGALIAIVITTVLLIRTFKRLLPPNTPPKT
jgi:F0F1-type ATP synthase assembly protein I